MKLFRRIFLEHPNDTNNPQGYWAHAKFSITNSLKGIAYMKAGIVHGIFPILFPFTTSSWIIRSFAKLVESNRHGEELNKYISIELVRKLLRDKKMSEKQRKWWVDQKIKMNCIYCGTKKKDGKCPRKICKGAIK